jgi:Flp pilus assembly protein TadG
MNRRDISHRLRQDRGQALIEFILVLPMIFLLIVNLVNFGAFFYAWIAVADAARSGADFAVEGDASAGAPPTPGGTDIVSVIRADMASLPNGSTATINVCQTRNGTLLTPVLAGTCTGIPADPESNYVLTSVQVIYTYRPFIAAFSFPKLGVYLTLPPTTITQTAAMRAII